MCQLFDLRGCYEIMPIFVLLTTKDPKESAGQTSTTPWENLVTHLKTLTNPLKTGQISSSFLLYSSFFFYLFFLFKFYLFISRERGRETGTSAGSSCHDPLLALTGLYQWACVQASCAQEGLWTRTQGPFPCVSSRVTPMPLSSPITWFLKWSLLTKDVERKLELWMVITGHHDTAVCLTSVFNIRPLIFSKADGYCPLALSQALLPMFEYKAGVMGPLPLGNTKSLFFSALLKIKFYCQWQSLTWSLTILTKI